MAFVPGEEHEFFGVRFIAVGAAGTALVEDSFYICCLCGGRFEFVEITTHAKYHKWEAFKHESLEMRIVELEKALTEMLGADVIPLSPHGAPARR